MAEEPREPEIEVIVLCKNEGDSLRPCLEAVLGQEGAGCFSVTVIDSGSTDGSVALAQSLPVRLIQIAPSEFHHARTRNLGAERTRAPIVVYTNGHTLPVGEQWLAKLTAPLRDDAQGNLAGVYGRQLPRDDAYPMERFMLSWFFGEVRRVQRAIPGQPIWREQTLFSTVNCALRRDLWQARPFSERVQVAEDQEWSGHWIEQGYAIVYEPEAAVVHSHNETCLRAFRRAYAAGAASEHSYLRREPQASARFVLSNLKRFADEMIYIAGEDHARWLPYAAVYESVRIAGWWLGRYRSGLPAPLKGRLVRPG